MFSFLVFLQICEYSFTFSKSYFFFYTCRSIGRTLVAMKTRFTTVDIRAVIAEINAKYVSHWATVARGLVYRCWSVFLLFLPPFLLSQLRRHEGIQRVRH